VNKELELLLDILRPLTYVVSEEEDRTIRSIYEKTKKDSKILVYRSTTGLLEYEKYKNEAEEKPKADVATLNIINVLNKIHDDITEKGKRTIYILSDIENYLTDSIASNSQFVRKLKDIVLQIYKDGTCIKSIIIISSSVVVPQKLQRYTEVVYDSLPSEEEIKTKIDGILTEYNNSVKDPTKMIDVNYEQQTINSLKGLTIFEIERITIASIKRYQKLSSQEITQYKKAILRKTSLLDIIEPSVSFDEVGGMDKLKFWLSKRNSFWTENGIKAHLPSLKGVLLIGITGCGKSYISQAIANYWQLPLISLNPSKVFSQRVGESESNMLKALKIVESMSPCILFIDEIEKGFAGSQSSSFSDAGTTSRVIGNFLTWYQDNTSPVFVVATCNSIQYLPPELVSRFDDKFFVNIPSTKERAAIFEIQLKKYGCDWKKTSISPLKLAEHSKQLTGREIEQVVKASMYEMFYDCTQENIKPEKMILKEEHLLKVLHTKVPILMTMEDEIKYLIQWVGWNNDKKDGVRANYANTREEDETDDINSLLNDVLNSKEDYSQKFKKK